MFPSSSPLHLCRRNTIGAAARCSNFILDLLAADGPVATVHWTCVTQEDAVQCAPLRSVFMQLLCDQIDAELSEMFS